MLSEADFKDLQTRLSILESIVEPFSDLLPVPKLFVSATAKGFLYENPDVRHFCLLKAVRTVSALNAALELAQKGYAQEIAMLMRIVTECTRHIEYVLDRDDSAEHRGNVEKYLRDFFDDVEREPNATIKGALIRDKQINEQLGKTLDRIAHEHGDSPQRVPAARLFHQSSR